MNNTLCGLAAWLVEGVADVAKTATSVQSRKKFRFMGDLAMTTEQEKEPDRLEPGTDLTCHDTVRLRESLQFEPLFGWVVLEGGCLPMELPVVSLSSLGKPSV